MSSHYSTARSNFAGESGGALYIMHQSKVTITSSYFSNNTAGDFGGAVGFEDCKYLCEYISVAF